MIVIIIRLSSLISLCIGFYLIIHAGGNLLESNAISKWSTVDGKVLSSKIVYLPRTVGIKRSYSVPIAKVEYIYDVDGVAYTSSRISFNDYGSNIKGQQQRIVDRYPIDKSVKVFYNPEKPESSILEHRTPIMHYITIAGGVIFLLIGLIFILIVPKILELKSIQKQTIKSE